MFEKRVDFGTFNSLVSRPWYASEFQPLPDEQAVSDSMPPVYQVGLIDKFLVLCGLTDLQ
jgi:hypothetical protein